MSYDSTGSNSDNKELIALKIDTLITTQGELLVTLNKENVERLGIFLNCGNEEKLIRVSRPENNTRTTQSKTVFSAIQQWRELKKFGQCVNTTAINIGRLGKPLFCLTNYYKKTFCIQHVSHGLKIILNGV